MFARILLCASGHNYDASQLYHLALLCHAAHLMGRSYARQILNLLLLLFADELHRGSVFNQHTAGWHVPLAILVAFACLLAARSALQRGISQPQAALASSDGSNLHSRLASDSLQTYQHDVETEDGAAGNACEADAVQGSQLEMMRVVSALGSAAAVELLQSGAVLGMPSGCAGPALPSPQAAAVPQESACEPVASTEVRAQAASAGAAASMRQHSQGQSQDGALAVSGKPGSRQHNSSSSNSHGNTTIGSNDSAAGANDSSHRSTQGPGQRASALHSNVRQLVGRLNTAVAEDPNRLVILGLIGSGAFGSVHKGRWRNMDVAVKTVRND